MNHSIRIAAALVAIFACSGCAISRGTRDPVSAGTAKLALKAGETSQTEVLQLFGGPNIVTGDGAGHETWTYDRMSYVSSHVAGGGSVVGAGPAGSWGAAGLLWGRASKASTSSRTVTLFLYWKQAELVDFKYRSASF